jgi:hypothetical protein
MHDLINREGERIIILVSPVWGDSRKVREEKRMLVKNTETFHLIMKTL